MLGEVSLVFIFLETNFGASGPVAAGSLMIRPRQGQWSEEGETLDPWDITDGRTASHADSLSDSGLPGTRSRKHFIIPLALAPPPTFCPQPLWFLGLGAAARGITISSSSTRSCLRHFRDTLCSLASCRVSLRTVVLRQITTSTLPK